MSRRPLYWRLLALRHVRPNAWQRAALAEGTIGLAAVLVLADVATAWTLLVLPLAVAVLVKAHDLLAGVLDRGVDGAAHAAHAAGPLPTGAQATAGGWTEEPAASRLAPPRGPGARTAPPR